MTIKLPSGVLAMLTLVFVVLKLTGTIAWPWLWVLSPLWIPLALGVAGVAIALVVALVALIFVKFFLKDIMKIVQSAKKEDDVIDV